MLLPTNFGFLNFDMKKNIKNHTLFSIRDFKYLRVHFAKPVYQGLLVLRTIHTLGVFLALPF